MRKIIKTVSHAEAMLVERSDDELADFKCVIVQHIYAPKQYWKTNENGYTADLEEAGLYTLEDAISSTRDEGYSILFVRDVEPEPGPDGKVRKRQAAVVLGDSLLGLVEASPTNPSARAHVMAKCGRMPPDELDTFQKIVDWIECDLELPVGVNPNLTSTRAEDQFFNGVMPVRVPPRPTPALTVEVENSEVERGKCSYSQTNTSRSNVPIPARLIAELVEEHPDDLESVMYAIYDYIQEHAYEHEINHHNTDPEHCDYECADTGDVEHEYNTTAVEAALITHLRTILTREQLDELELD